VRAPTELDSMCTGVVANVTARGVLVYEGMDMPDTNLYPRPPEAIAENQFCFYITIDAVYSLGGG